MMTHNAEIHVIALSSIPIGGRDAVRPSPLQCDPMIIHTTDPVRWGSVSPSFHTLALIVRRTARGWVEPTVGVEPTT